MKTKSYWRMPKRIKRKSVIFFRRSLGVTRMSVLSTNLATNTPGELTEMSRSSYETPVTQETSSTRHHRARGLWLNGSSPGRWGWILELSPSHSWGKQHFSRLRMASWPSLPSTWGFRTRPGDAWAHQDGQSSSQDHAGNRKQVEEIGSHLGSWCQCLL